MSATSKSNEKNSRFPGTKTKDYVNKTRTNEANRAPNARSQGFISLGKVNNRRVPPPAKVPSLRSETGTNAASFDTGIPSSTSHAWTASGNQTSNNLATNQTRPLTPSKQPTQQQLDSLPAHVSTPPISSSTLSSDIDKPRGSTTWSTITTGSTTANANDQPPNLLTLNDFPRLATQDTTKTNTESQSDSLITSLSTSQGPSLRPANLASWREGGGRAQPMSNELTKESNDNNNISTFPMQSQIPSTNANSNLIQNSTNPSFMRMYQTPQTQQQTPMWSHHMGNSYGPYGINQVPGSSMAMHSLQHPQRVSSYGNSAQSQSQQRITTSTDYKTPTILRNKDIDDLSKLTDNVTWASTPQEVNYEEKIRFSDDEDNDIVDTNKPRRLNTREQQPKQTYPQVLQNPNTNRSIHINYSQQTTTRTRLLQEDEHVKQMQDDKNSELMNTLTVAKQRRDEQERNLRDLSQRSSSTTTTTTTASTNVSKSFDDHKQMPGYQTRPLMSSTGQDNINSPQIDSSSVWTQSTNSTTSISRTRHDTADSQTFAMKSWSDQMDSFNYASLHENTTNFDKLRSGGQVDADDHHDDGTTTIPNSTSASRKYSRSQSESSTQSQTDKTTINSRTKPFVVSHRRQPNSNQSKPSINTSRTGNKTTDVSEYLDSNEQHMKSNEQWGDWDDTSFSQNNRYSHSYTNNRRGNQQQNFTEDSSYKSNRQNEQTNDFQRTKQTIKTRTTNVSSRPTDISLTTKTDTKTVTTKTPAPWRPLSPTRPIDSTDPTPQESISFKSQIKINDTNDRRQSAPIERKQRYTTATTPINTAAIPSLMSVRSDVPPTPIQAPTTTTTSKHYKTSNQSQRQDYTNSSHYSQRNDFYNETNDSTWANDDEYYEDETGYYDPNVQSHQRHHHSMGYHSTLHHRGYIALGSYGRYRRGGTLRHQQQYNTYNFNTVSNTTSQPNTNVGLKTKKTTTTRTVTPKKTNEVSDVQKPISDSLKTASEEKDVKQTSAWNLDKNLLSTDEISKTKSNETSIISTEIEKPKETPTTILEQKSDIESNVVQQTDTDSTITLNKKQTIIPTQKKTNKDQQNYHYSNQQTTNHRHSYGRSLQDYDTTQMTGHNYYSTSHRTTRGSRNARIEDLSGGYYYEHPQQRYNTRYNYSVDHYSKQQKRPTIKTTKRADSSSAVIDHQQTTKTSGNSTNLRLHSASDNEQKEGEEWETASESSTNMRSNHPDTSQQQITKSTGSDTKSINRDRTPPKKSFSNQRPLNTRFNESIATRRLQNSNDRITKTNRTAAHRTSRLTISQKSTLTLKSEIENTTTTTTKKDQHRHSLEGYDLNNVAGVVKIETLPASALEEENEILDDGGEEFCLVMSKRDRKEQKAAAQLSKQNALESNNNINTITDQTIKSTTNTNIEQQQINEKISDDINQTNTTRVRTGKSVPPRFNSKSTSSTTRQHNTKTDHKNSSTYYYDQNYYYYDQSQYYDNDNSYYNYGGYNQSHRHLSTRRKQRSQQTHDTHITDDHTNERKSDGNTTEKTHSTTSNVMSNIQMWNPQTDNTISNASKLIEKPVHDRKYGHDIVPSSSSRDSSLPLHQRAATDLTTHSTISKTNEPIARTIKPPLSDNKTNRDTKTKSASFEKNDTIGTLGSNQLFEKSTFLDYDDKQSIGTVGDDYNEKINSLKPIWDASHHPSIQLESTINSMVAMKQKQQQQQQENNTTSNTSTKSDTYVQESKSTTSTNITVTNTNVSSTNNDDSTNKNSTSTGNLSSTTSATTINQQPTYSTNTVSNKNEQKNICTVKPTQQVAPNIQDQVDVMGYPSFPGPPLPPPMTQTTLPQHLLPQSQVNQLHQPHTYPFYENLLPAPPLPPLQQQPPSQPQQQQFNRYPQNFSYRNANIYMQPPPNVPNTNSMYHHPSQAPPQNNTLPPPIPNYPSSFLMDPGGHIISHTQPPQTYMNNQMMSGTPQSGAYYRTPPPPAPSYGTQDPLAHGPFYSPFIHPPNSNAPSVGHPLPHNLYGQNEGFHPPHPQMFARAGSIDRNDHTLLSQPSSRQTNYPSTSSNQQPRGPPPSLLSQNLKPFAPNQQQTSTSNQTPFYPSPNQYPRQPMPIGAMNTTNNRQQTPQVPSLMSGFSKNISNNGTNLNTTLFQSRPPFIHAQPTNNNRQYSPHTQYPTYSKSTGQNDDNIKQKHL